MFDCPAAFTLSPRSGALYVVNSHAPPMVAHHAQCTNATNSHQCTNSNGGPPCSNALHHPVVHRDQTFAPCAMHRYLTFPVFTNQCPNNWSKSTRCINYHMTKHKMSKENASENSRNQVLQKNRKDCPPDLNLSNFCQNYFIIALYLLFIYFVRIHQHDWSVRGQKYHNL